MMKFSRGSTASTPEDNRTTTLLARICTSTTSTPFTKPRSGSKLRVIMYLITVNQANTASLISVRDSAILEVKVYAGSSPGTNFTLQYSRWRTGNLQTLHEFITVQVRIFALYFDVGSCSIFRDSRQSGHNERIDHGGILQGQAHYVPLELRIITENMQA
jgi:hypothetical protein